MSDIFFSVIIPAYNTANYIEGCIKSILEQNYDNFEIIIADDSSTDGTRELADKIAADDNRIRVLHLQHGGVSAARNAGIKEAAGKYALFVDSDDRLQENAFNVINSNLAGNPDMLWFDFLYKTKDEAIAKNQKLPDICYENAEDAVCDWIKKDMLPVSACNKAFRLAKIKEFNIRFREEYSFGEDRLFMLDFLKYCGRIVIISDKLYIYEIREGSASHRFVPQILQIMLALHKERVSVLSLICKEKMPATALNAFLNKDYIKSVAFAWLYLAEYYKDLTSEQKIGELKVYLNIRFPKEISLKLIGFKQYVLFSFIKIAARLNSVIFLKLLMSFTIRFALK